MVRLDRIYTRSGDSGKTFLGDGNRVDKTSQRIVVMGAVDEVNCHLGTAISLSKDSDLRQLLSRIQQLLFDLGADLCSPIPVGPSADPCLRIAKHHSVWLEARIDETTVNLNPLTSFILPGGRPAAAALHLARSVCRRAELEFLRLIESSESACTNAEVGIFLNRLSDLLFVLARRENADGADDVLWTAGSAVDKD
ncbi:MAG: cob(I)yrinic acid a,c-diamide adenosyltransferase [Fuerstiella sp.]|nr:cob(I)yrinic acid a,c-diamide adenosyltransferase [Fuerstiella sp.]